MNNDNLFPKLEKFLNAPQKLNDDFCEIYGRPSSISKFFSKGSFLNKALGEKNILVESFSKESWEETATNSNIVYTCVVQANNVLYKPGNEFAAAVLLFSPDKDKCRDANFLAEVADKLYELKSSKNVPEDAKNLVNLLIAGDSLFVEEVPSSLTSGVKVVAFVENLDQSTDLPNKAIPENKIIPAFFSGEYKVGYFSGTKKINAKFF